MVHNYDVMMLFTTLVTPVVRVPDQCFEDQEFKQQNAWSLHKALLVQSETPQISQYKENKWW